MLQRLRGHQVHVGVDAHQPLAGRGDLILLEVAKVGEHVADPVELTRDGVGALLDPALEGAGVAGQLVVALGPAGVVLTVGATVAGVGAQLGPQPTDLALALALPGARLAAR